MTIDPEWRDFAAIWGAVLSSLLALARFLPDRPQFEIEPGKSVPCDLILRIINPAKSMRLVRDLCRIKIGRGGANVIGLYIEKTRLIDTGIPGTLLLAIKAESEREVMINCLSEKDKPSRWLILFLWRGSWFLPIYFPAFVYVSTKRATKLNAAL
ncbi:hypothetical protein HUN39_15595 [Methylocystis sp. FS]|uniref:hypothetical protein n=1 Tax=Methylocystis silviterrae TaxID=2743612 RepID=UPI001582F523|nr:hypothetical protein [Methylocystis silviterrae]NUJ81422.1 hypothetical protein [Methylocystis silviterrae]